MTDLLIPDVSEFQNVIDWPNFGADAVIVRINYGNVKVDNYADRNIDGARSRCAWRGWYTYLIATDDPVADADVFVRVLQAHGGLKPGEAIICDDEEGTGDQSPRVNAFFAEVNAKLNANASEDMWYSGLNFSIAHNLQSANGRKWVAAYGQAEPTVPHDLWQETDAATVAGVTGNVDMSVFHGDINQLIALFGGSVTIQDSVVPSSPVAGKTFQTSTTWLDWNTLVSVGQTVGAGVQILWTEAKEVNNVWYDRIAKDASGTPGDWCLPDSAIDDGGFDPTRFRPAPPLPPVPDWKPVVDALTARVAVLEQFDAKLKAAVA